MLGWTLTFLIIAVIAAAFGFGGIAVAAAHYRQDCRSISFLVLFLAGHHWLAAAISAGDEVQRRGSKPLRSGSPRLVDDHPRPERHGTTSRNRGGKILKILLRVLL